jgi:hypothetical protein
MNLEKALKKVVAEPSGRLLWDLSKTAVNKLKKLSSASDIKLVWKGMVPGEDFRGSQVSFKDQDGNKWDLIIDQEYRQAPSSKRLVEDVKFSLDVLSD